MKFPPPERFLVGGILLAALLVRIGAGIGGVVISHDGARFVKMARHIDRADYDQAFHTDAHMPPGYPLFIRLFALAFANYGIGAIAVSAIFGALAALPLYAMAKSMAGEKTAAVTSILYAFMPEVACLHGEIMSEGLFIFFFLTWMWLLWSGSREPHWTKFALAGFFGALAYLTRPEGIYAVAGTVGWLAITARKRPLAHLGGAVCFLLVFLVVASPYLLWIHSSTGKWKLTANPFAEGIFDRLTGKTESAAKEADPDSEFKEERARAKYGRVGGPLMSIARETIKVGFYVFPFIGLLGLGLARYRGLDNRGALFLILFILGYGIPNIVAMMTDQPFGFRYIMPSVIFGMPFIAIGVLEIVKFMKLRWVVAVVCLGMLGAMTVKAVKPRRGDRADLKQAGRFIRDTYGPGRKLAAMDRRVEFYAEGDYVPVPQDLDALPGDVEFVVLYDRQLKHYPEGFAAKAADRYREIGKFKGATVYATGPSQR